MQQLPEAARFLCRRSKIHVTFGAVEVVRRDRNRWACRLRRGRSEGDGQRDQGNVKLLHKRPPNLYAPAAAASTRRSALPASANKAAWLRRMARSAPGEHSAARERTTA